MGGLGGKRKQEATKEGEIVKKKTKGGSESEEVNIGELTKALPHDIRENILDMLNPMELHRCYFFYGVPSHNEMVKKYLNNRWYGMAHMMLNDTKSDAETYRMVIVETPLNKPKSEFGDSHYVILSRALEKMKQLSFPRSMELFEKLILHSNDDVVTEQLYKDMVRECSGTVKPQVYGAVLNAIVNRDLEEAIKFVGLILVDKGIKFDVSSLVKRLARENRIKDIEHILKAIGGCEPVFIKELVKSGDRVETWDYAYNLVYESAKSKLPKTEQLLKAFVSSIWGIRSHFHRSSPRDIWRLHILERCFGIVMIIGKVPDKETCVPIAAALQKVDKEEEAMFMFQCGVCEPRIENYNDLREWASSIIAITNCPF